MKTSGFFGARTKALRVYRLQYSDSGFSAINCQKNIGFAPRKAPLAITWFTNEPAVARSARPAIAAESIPRRRIRARLEGVACLESALLRPP